MSFLSHLQPEDVKILEEDGEEITLEFGPEVVVRTQKGGLIHSIWLQELQARKTMPVSHYEITGEGEFAETPLPTTTFSRLISRAAKVLPPSPLSEQLAAQEKDELAGWQARLSVLRKQLAPLPWCDHEAEICTGSCKILEEIQELEKKCLRDP